MIKSFFNIYNVFSLRIYIYNLGLNISLHFLWFVFLTSDDVGDYVRANNDVGDYVGANDDACDYVNANDDASDYVNANGDAIDKWWCSWHVPLNMLQNSNKTYPLLVLLQL